MAKTWWCRGGGAAVLFLLAVVVVFRDARDVIFWAAIALFAVHTALTGWRYRDDRRARTTATVLHHHHAHPVSDRVPPLVFAPLPITSLIRLDIPPK